MAGVQTDAVGLHCVEHLVDDGLARRLDAERLLHLDDVVRPRLRCNHAGNSHDGRHIISLHDQIESKYACQQARQLAKHSRGGELGRTCAAGD
jgi:hypothetical protein